MTTKIPKIDRMIKKAQRSLKLASYKVRCNLVEADYSEYAGIICQHPKRAAIIDFNRKRIHQELENTVIHELLHLLFNKHLSVAEDVFERQRKYKSLQKYQKGEEKIINILAPLLEKAIFGKDRRTIVSAKNLKNYHYMSFPRRRESRKIKGKYWIPASAGMTQKSL